MVQEEGQRCVRMRRRAARIPALLAGKKEKNTKTVSKNARRATMLQSSAECCPRLKVRLPKDKFLYALLCVKPTANCPSANYTPASAASPRCHVLDVSFSVFRQGDCFRFFVTPKLARQSACQESRVFFLDVLIVFLRLVFF